MHDTFSFSTLRLVASLLATGAAILLCASLNHFSPSLSDPSSFLLATHHRCGWVLIGSAAWALFESVLSLARSGPLLTRP